MSGHPIYYPWQGRAPQPPSLPTHSFNPWQPRAHKLRLTPPPPNPSPVGAPRRAQWRGSAPCRGHGRGRGGRTPIPSGARVGERVPLLRPSLLRHLVRSAPGQSRDGGDLCCPLPRRAAHGGRCSPRLATAAAPLPREGKRVSLLPPGRSRCWVGAGQRRFPSMGAAACASGVVLTPAPSHLGLASSGNPVQRPGFWETGGGCVGCKW